jgi:hypothetical protein
MLPALIRTDLQLEVLYVLWKALDIQVTNKDMKDHDSLNYISACKSTAGKNWVALTESLAVVRIDQSFDGMPTNSKTLEATLREPYSSGRRHNILNNEICLPSVDAD